MRILLTGARGLLGNLLKERLAELGTCVATDLWAYQPGAVAESENVIEVNCDLRDYAAIYRIFHDYKITHVVHAGAISHPGPSFQNPVTAVQVNLDATVTLLEASRLFNVKRFVFVSTIGVYGQYRSSEVTEDHVMEGNSPYGVAKIAAELMGNCYYRTYGLPFTSLRYGHIYGPSRKMPCPVKMVVESAVHRTPLVLPGGSDAPLHLIYEKDAVAPVLRALETQGLCGEAVNIVDGAIHTLGEVVNNVKEILPEADIAIGPGPLPREITGLPPEPGENVRIVSSKAINQLGVEFNWPLEGALRDYVSTLKERRPD